MEGCSIKPLTVIEATRGMPLAGGGYQSEEARISVHDEFAREWGA